MGKGIDHRKENFIPLRNLTLLLLNTLTFAGMLYLNYFFASGAGGKETVGEISDRYSTLITPASYAFSIWGLIYLLLMGFVAFQWVEYAKGRTEDSLEKTGIWLIMSNVFNGLWIVLWINERIGLSVVVIFLLLISLIQLVIRLKLELWDAPMRIIVFVWWPICIYLGWVILATVINVAVYFSAGEMLPEGLSPQIWTYIMIAVAVTIYVVLTYSRYMREASLVGVWGISAIAWRHWGSNEDLVMAALIGAGVLLITSGHQAFKNFKTTPFYRAIKK